MSISNCSENLKKYHRPTPVANVSHLENLQANWEQNLYTSVLCKVEEYKEVRNSVEKSYSWSTRARNPHGKLDITSLWEPLKH